MEAGVLNAIGFRIAFVFIGWRRPSKYRYVLMYLPTDSEHGPHAKIMIIIPLINDRRISPKTNILNSNEHTKISKYATNIIGQI